MSIAELQSAVQSLPDEDREWFFRWLSELMEDQWNGQFEANVLCGRLDQAGRRADDDFEAGRCTSLSYGSASGEARLNSQCRTSASTISSAISTTTTISSTSIRVPPACCTSRS